MNSEETPNLGTTYLPGIVGAERLSVALIGPDETRRQAMARALAQTPLADVREFLFYPSRLDHLERLLEQPFDVVILDLDSDPDTALLLVEKIGANDAITVMVYSENADTKLAVRYMRAGAREFVVLPLDQRILDEALTRTAALLREKARPREETRLSEETQGSLLVLLSAKGGSGVTTIACNLAIALAQEFEQKTLLIDLALPIGDAALSLGITAEFSTDDAFRSADRLDTRLLREMLVEHKSGLFVLAAPSQIPEVEASKYAIDRLVTVARREFDHVVVDLGSRVDVSGTALFKEASRIYLVTLTGVSELRNSNRMISKFFAASGPNLEVVINRFEDRFLGVVNEDVVTRALGRPVQWKIPDDREAAREMQYGETGTARTRISRLSLEMAGSITGRPVPQKKKKSFDLKGFSRSIAEDIAGNDVPPSMTIAPPAIVRASPTISWPNPDPITYGTLVGATQLCATASVPGTFDYSPALGALLPAGKQTLAVTFTPTDSENYAAAKAIVSINVARAIPAIDWPKPKPFRCGTLLSTSQLCATASVPGTFDYSPAPGELLGAGTHTLSVSFTPADNANYASANATVSLTVMAKATPSIEWPTPRPITQDTQLGTNELCAKASVPGTFDYSPAPGELLGAGTHTLSAAFAPADSENYAKVQATVSLTVIAKAIPVIAWSNPDPITFGTPLGARQLCASASVPGTLDYSPAPGEVLAAGAHSLSAAFTPADSKNYATTEATVSLEVAKAVPVIAWPTPPPVMDGTQLSSAQLCATASVPGTFHYSPLPGVVPSPGTHSLSVTFSPADGANYATANATVLLTVMAKAVPDIAWSKPDPITYGTQLSSTQLCATASAPGTFDYSPAQGEVLAAGTQTLSVTFTPTDSANYATAKATASLDVARAAPAIEWPKPEPITYGTLVGATQLCATASVPGTFDYSPALGALLPAGKQTLSATFTPRDSENYTVAKATVSIDVARAVPTIDWPKPKPIQCGTLLSTTQLNATASVPGTFGYSPAPGELLGAGTHTLSAAFTPTDSANYATTQATVSLKVAKAMPTIDWSKPDPITYGTLLSTTQLCATASVPGTFDYSPAPGELLGAGTHTLSATFTPADGEKYATTQATVSLDVAMATPAIDWPTPQPIQCGTPLDAAQLCATASVPGTFDYSPAPGEMLPAGTHALSVTFVPTGANYATAKATVSLNVAKAALVIKWPNPDPIIYGTLLSATQLCATASVPGTFDYSPAPGALLPVGTHSLSLTFTPSDCANFATTLATVSLSVAKATPIIEWPMPEPTTCDTMLGTKQLCATASIPGVFDYSPAPGHALTAGTHVLSVTFTPTDSANYTTTRTTVSLDVTMVKPSIDWPTPKPIKFGTALGAAQLRAAAWVPGTFVYSPAAGEVLPQGTHTLSVTFIPTNNENYATVQATVLLEVEAGAKVAISWSKPKPITYGTLLSSTQLGATASIPGTFDYSPPQGEVLSAGKHTLSVTFTPTDSANYAAAKATVTLSVARATPVIAWPEPDPIVYGTLLGSTQLRATASVPGTFEYSPASGEQLSRGMHTLSVTFTPKDRVNYATAKAAVSLNVAKDTPSIDWPTPQPIECGTPLDAAQLCATASIPGIFEYFPSLGKVLPEGTHTLSVSFTPSDTEKYALAQAMVALEVERLRDYSRWYRIAAAICACSILALLIYLSPQLISTAKSLAKRVIGRISDEQTQPIVTPARSNPVTISPGVANKLLIHRSKPVYPPSAKLAHVSGTVELDAIISETGTIKDLHVVNGPAMLQQAAVDAVRTWRYKPYKINNEPTEVETTIKVNFSLGE